MFFFKKYDCPTLKVYRHSSWVGACPGDFKFNCGSFAGYYSPLQPTKSFALQQVRMRVLVQLYFSLQLI